MGSATCSRSWARTSCRSAPASRRGSRCRRRAARGTASCKHLIESENLHTVCQEAACPNIGECWQRGTATFMILGDTCTRRCGFCNVKTGKPTWNDPLEPARVARSVARMGLRHAVITSVDRDDLPDYGASAFVGVIRQIRRQAPTLQGRGADPRLPRRGDAARQGDRRTPRRVQPQRRGRPPSLPAGAARLEVRALLPGAAKRQGDRRRRGDHQVRPDGRPGRELRRDGRRARDAPREPRPGPDRGPVPAGPPRTTCRSSATGTPTSSRQLEQAAYALGFEHVAAGPLVRSSYHADQHVPQHEPGIGPLRGGVGAHEPPAPRAAGRGAWWRSPRSCSRRPRWRPPAAAPAASAEAAVAAAAVAVAAAASASSS